MLDARLYKGHMFAFNTHAERNRQRLLTNTQVREIHLREKTLDTTFLSIQIVYNKIKACEES